jgi:dephospho-CoA kinase
MIKVGLTGGIGAGKSYVCRIFQNLEIPVFSADVVAKEIIRDNQSVKNQLIALLGIGVYYSDGTINRKKMAELIFNDDHILQKVNSIVHPAVRKAFVLWSEQQTSDYVIQESAILFESERQCDFDQIITVTAPFELKVSRVMKRDKISEVLVEERIKNQLPDAFKIEKSDFIINTDDGVMILPQIINIHNTLKNYGEVW